MNRIESDIEAALTAVADVSVDVEATLMTVRRAAQHRRRRRVALSTGAAALIVGAGIPAVVALRPNAASHRAGSSITGPRSTAATTTPGFTGSCTVQELPLPPEIAALEGAIVRNIQVADMDPTGRYTVGGANQLNIGDPFVIRWDGTTPEVLTVHDAFLTAGGVNSAGDVVGEGMTHMPGVGAGNLQGGAYAWLYANDALVVLPMPDGFVGVGATAINEAGQIAGFAERADGTGVAVRWDANAAHTVHVLGSPGSWARGDAIAEDGTVVGVTRDALPTDADLWRGQPYAWAPDGTRRALPLPRGEAGGISFQVRGDWVAGYTAHPDGVKVVGNISKAETGFTAVRWRLSTGEVSIVDSQDHLGISIGVNSSGDIAFSGTGEDPGGNPTYKAPVLVHAGQSYDLPLLSLSTKDSLPPNAAPVALSDDATVIVGHHSSSVFGTPTPVVRWHC
jgi:hypothetical protein